MGLPKEAHQDPIEDDQKTPPKRGFFKILRSPPRKSTLGTQGNAAIHLEHRIFSEIQSMMDNPIE